MAEKNIELNIHNGKEYDTLYPKTKANNVSVENFSELNVQDVLTSINAKTIEGSRFRTADNDMLRIGLNSDYSHINNQPSHIAIDDASKLKNFPINKGPFFGTRYVFIAGHLYTVFIIESYPHSGRIWTNTYNVRNWSGWQEYSNGSNEIYNVNGLILNSQTDNIIGSGSATVTCYSNRIAQIDFSISITRKGTSPTFSWGLNRDILSNINPSIPYITPRNGGIVTCYNPQGNIRVDLMGYGGTLVVPAEHRQFWRFDRVYLPEGTVGGWDSTTLNVGDKLIGTCYGNY